MIDMQEKFPTSNRSSLIPCERKSQLILPYKRPDQRVFLYNEIAYEIYDMAVWKAARHNYQNIRMPTHYTVVLLRSTVLSLQ